MKKILTYAACAFVAIAANAQIIPVEMRGTIAARIQEQMVQNPPRDNNNFARYVEANKTAPKGADAVFMGNSITDFWPQFSPAFFADNNYIGRGINGQVTTQMLVRFRADVIALQPKCVVIMAGTNDICGIGESIAPEDIAGNIFSMCELSRAHGIIPIICSVTPVAHYWIRPDLEPAQDIIEFNRLLKAYADKEGLTYVDYHSALKDGRNGLPEKYSDDDLHPNTAGYAVMEALVKPAIEKALGR